jgi:cyclic peptide transporter
MEILKVFFNRSKFFALSLLVVCIMNGLLSMSLLFFINNKIANVPLPFLSEYDWAIFIVILLLALLANRSFQMSLITLTNDILFEFEVSMLQKLKQATYQSLEKMGNEKVMTAIEDNRSLAAIPGVFTSAFNSLIIIVCCVAYFFWVSWQGGILIVILLALLFIFYYVRNAITRKQLVELRGLIDLYYSYLGDLIYGFKEIKMSKARNENIFLKFLIKNRIQNKTISKKVATDYLNNQLTGNYSWYVILGVILFVLPEFFDSNLVVTGAYITTILYLIGPVSSCISLIPNHTKIRISYNRLKEFEDKLKEKSETEVQIKSEALILEKFGSLRFENVTFEYSSDDDKRSFFVGPISVEISDREIIFITGGNGSGKSTFINLLTGLYRPLSGNIYYNSQLISSADYNLYSNQIAAIFAKCYLFSENYDEFDLPDNSKYKYYAEMMKLTNVLHYDEKKKTIDINLSSGQQKRLALIYALMEEKHILVLDEWAAEQDPDFRRYFYNTMIPYFKKIGKTVLAVTHDDDYFHVSDRVIKFSFGQIVSETLNKKIEYQMEQ